MDFGDVPPKATSLVATLSTQAKWIDKIGPRSVELEGKEPDQIAYSF